MGADLYWLEKSVREDNGAMAQGIINEIIDVVDSDEPFKLQKIEKLVDKWKNNKKRV